MGELVAGAVLGIGAMGGAVSAGAGREDEDEVMDITSVPVINLTFRSTDTLGCPAAALAQ